MISVLSRLRPIAEHLVAVGMFLVAASPWLEVTAGSASRICIFGAVAGASVVGIITAHTSRRRPWTELVISVGALMVFIQLVVLRDPLGFTAMVRGLRDGTAQILSTTLPILAVPSVNIPGVMIVWSGAGFATGRLARTRSIAAPIAAAGAVFVGGYVATIGGRSGDPASFSVRQALLLVVLVGVLVMLRTGQNLPQGQHVRAVLRVVSAVGAIGASLVIAATMAGWAPYLSDVPVQPRMQPPAEVREPTSPLLVTRELRSREPERVVGRISASEPWSGYVPLAVLDRYDGRIWELTQTTFVPTGGAVPVAVPVGSDIQVRLDQVDTHATGGWLPFVARPASVAGLAVLHNGGSALQPAGGGQQVSYQLRLSQPSYHLEDEYLGDGLVVARGVARSLDVAGRSARRPAGERLCRLLAVSRDPTAERSIAGHPCGRSRPDAVAFLHELVRQLREGRSISDDLVGGRQLTAGSESLSDLLDLVSQSGTQAAVGTPEQFASAFALIADDLGIPARLVTGFRVPTDPGGDTVEFRGEHAWTWVEVPIEELGWVVIDPSPTAEDVVSDDGQDGVELSDPDPRDASEPERAVLGVDTSDVIGRAPVPESPGLWMIAGVVGAVMAALMLAVIAASALRRVMRRRRRRRAHTARGRMLGAWHEALDQLYDAGRRDLESLSAGDVVVGLSADLPELVDPLAGFAEAANRAIFSSQSFGDDEVEGWWMFTRRLKARLRRATPWRYRLLALLLPAPADLSTQKLPRPDVTAASTFGRD